MINVTKKNILEAYNRTSQKVNIKSLNHLIKDKKDYVFVNKNTGLVFRDRQISNSFTADKYSELIFSKKKEFTNFQYGDSPPAVKARHNYVYNTLNDFLDLKKKFLTSKIGKLKGTLLKIQKNYFEEEHEPFFAVLLNCMDNAYRFM